MKIAITGHTKGIGKALADKFSVDYTVVGYSRSNGYDISNEEIRKKIVEESKDCSVFVNNAYDPIGQTDLLKRIIDASESTDRLIINISSKLAYFPKGSPFDNYTRVKEEQNNIIANRFLKGSPRVLNVITGLVDTDMAKVFVAPKIKLDDFSNLIYMLVQFQTSIAVQEIVIDVPGLNWKDIKSNVA